MSSCSKSKQLSNNKNFQTEEVLTHTSSIGIAWLNEGKVIASYRFKDFDYYRIESDNEIRTKSKRFIPIDIPKMKLRNTLLQTPDSKMLTWYVNLRSKYVRTCKSDVWRLIKQTQFFTRVGCSVSEQQLYQFTWQEFKSPFAEMAIQIAEMAMAYESITVDPIDYSYASYTNLIKCPEESDCFRDSMALIEKSIKPYMNLKKRYFLILDSLYNNCLFGDGYQSNTKYFIQNPMNELPSTPIFKVQLDSTKEGFSIKKALLNPEIMFKEYSCF
jgi:hypothetical protein